MLKNAFGKRRHGVRDRVTLSMHASAANRQRIVDSSAMEAVESVLRMREGREEWLSRRGQRAAAQAGESEAAGKRRLT